MDQQIWQWTLSSEAVAPCFVRDVLDMRPHAVTDTDFFWLGHTPCRTVLLVGMVVAVQVYDKRAIYTIDDGTAVIGCVLRHSPAMLPGANRPSPTTLHTEPPPPITEPGYPVRVVGRVVRHYHSKQIHADTIDLCASSLDEIAHLQRVIGLHKTKYSRAIPFVLPSKPLSRAPPPSTSTPHGGVSEDTSVSRPGLDSTSYTLRAPPPMPLPLQNGNRSSSISTHVHPAHQTRVPSSPTASSIASSTPSSPCKPSSPVKAHEASRKNKMRHPSRLHTRDLTANTFRIYVKHYMDNAPPPFLTFCSSPSRSTCGDPTTPTKRVRDGGEDDEFTPRPRSRANMGKTTRLNDNDTDGEEEDASKLGFTLSHLRRVPELVLLAARVVRAEARKRDKADREKERAALLPKSNGQEENKSIPRASTALAVDPPRKKVKRLFSWAVVKLYEEGSIVLWDGDVRPLPVPPPPEGGDRDGSRLWKRNDDTLATIVDSSSSCTSASVLYTLSTSASLYSHYHAPRPSGGRPDVVDADADPAYLSDPPADEEAYIPLTPHLLARYVQKALGAVRRGGTSVSANRRRGATRKEPTPEDILTYMHRTDGRWARLSVWAVEEALALLRTG